MNSYRCDVLVHGKIWVATGKAVTRESEDSALAFCHDRALTVDILAKGCGDNVIALYWGERNQHDTWQCVGFGVQDQATGRVMVRWVLDVVSVGPETLFSRL